LRIHSRRTLESFRFLPMKKFAIGVYVAVTLALMVWGFCLASGAFHLPFGLEYLVAPNDAMQGEISRIIYYHVPSWAVAFSFFTVGLTTGPIWARRAWGIWWTWDARLTTTLVLWLIYVSYLLLRRFAAGPQMQTLAAVLGIFGALDVPIVYMSNRWWRTQHPAPVFGGGAGSGMAWSMTRVLLWNLLAWFAWGVMLLLIRYHVERHRQKI